VTPIKLQTKDSIKEPNMRTKTPKVVIDGANKCTLIERNQVVVECKNGRFYGE